MTQPAKDLALVLQAANFAAEAHREQRRKGARGRPYVNHPIEVAALLSEHGVDDPVTLAAALLHDTVEDTDATPQDLRDLFGEAVASVVAEVTDDKSLPKERRKELQVEHAPHLSAPAKLVKLCDKISNVSEVLSDPPEGWPQARKEHYVQWAKEVVGALGPVHPELEQRFHQIAAQGVEGQSR